MCAVPPKVLLDSANQAVSQSERVMLDCPISDADPAPVILWTKNDQPLQLDARVQQLYNGSLAIYDSAVSISRLPHSAWHGFVRGPGVVGWGRVEEDGGRWGSVSSEARRG